MEPGYSYHMSFGLDILMEYRHHLRIEVDGVSRVPTVEELQKIIDEYAAKGYQYLTCCDNVDAKGCCKGHPIGRSS